MEDVLVILVTMMFKDRIDVKCVITHVFHVPLVVNMVALNAQFPNRELSMLLNQLVYVMQVFMMHFNHYVLLVIVHVKLVLQETQVAVVLVTQHCYVL